MTLITKNKKAYHDYEILETQEAGLELFGYEVKALRAKQVNLKGSYCSVINNELWVKAMHI
jgi:SsrA-binding protein